MISNITFSLSLLPALKSQASLLKHPGHFSVQPDKKTVVLNLETASPENKRRIIDFLIGVAYANGGSLKPVANLTYIITPYNVGFIGEDLVGELENNGVII